MARRIYDPLAAIPRPAAVREKLSDVEQLAERLRRLLRISEEIHETKPGEQGKEVALAR